MDDQKQNQGLKLKLDDKWLKRQAALVKAVSEQPPMTSEEIVEQVKRLRGTKESS